MRPQKEPAATQRFRDPMRVAEIVYRVLVDHGRLLIVAEDATPIDDGTGLVPAHFDEPV